MRCCAPGGPPTPRVTAPAPAADDDLSSRDCEVPERKPVGDGNRPIARALDIGPHTVKRRVANILAKSGRASRGQVATWLREHAGLDLAWSGR